MDINELKNNIENILEEIEKGQYHIPIVNEMKGIDVILLTTDDRITGNNLNDIKKAVNELELEEKIILIPPEGLLLKLIKLLVENYNDNVIFGHSFIKKANEELLKAYKKLKDYQNKK